MSSPAELYAAILADPDDMALRLAYADAVEATDPDHAALIRTQIDKVQLRAVDFRRTPQAAQFAGLSLHLRDKLGDRLTAPIAHLVAAADLQCGFPEIITLPGADFLAHGEAIYQRAPVRHVVLTGVDADFAPELFASPLLDRLSSLDLDGNPLGDKGVIALANSTHLQRLRWLSLDDCDIDRTGAEAIAAGARRNLPNLQWLSFRLNSAPLVPIGEFFDINGNGPLEVRTSDFSTHLNERYGPFPWMDEAWAWFFFKPEVGSV